MARSAVQCLQRTIQINEITHALQNRSL